MSTRIEKLYRHPIFEQLKGLPEALVKFESETGLSLPDVFGYTFLPVFEVENSAMIIGKIGFIYVVAMQKEEKMTYELHENKQAIRLWAAETVMKMTDADTVAKLKEEEKQNLEKNTQAFMERVETLIEKAE